MLVSTIWIDLLLVLLPGHQFFLLNLVYAGLNPYNSPVKDVANKI